MKKNTVSVCLLAAVCFSCESKKSTETNYSTTTEEVTHENEQPADGTAVDASADSANITETATTTAPAYTSDADFVMMAASGGMMEVEGGKTAAAKATNADVKKFGQHMVDDHSKANTELMALAKKKNWKVPAAMNPEHKAELDKVAAMKGTDFDKAYMAAMVKDHEKDVALFESASKNATDPDLKAWAAKTLPTLQMHLEMARTNNAKVNKM